MSQLQEILSSFAKHSFNLGVAVFVSSFKTVCSFYVIINL